MKCPGCGNSGKPDSRPIQGVPPAFEFRGRLGGRVIVRCLRCSGGVFVRMFPPGSKAISVDEWRLLDAYWNLRRAEILADVQALQQYPSQRPLDEQVAESQSNFPSQTMRVSSLINTVRVAGYGTDGPAMNDLMKNKPVEFARLGFVSRAQNVVHNNYQAFLAMGGAPQTEKASARIAAARDALAGGDEAVRAFLSNPAIHREAQ